MNGIKVSNGTYKYYDTVNGGYLNRGQCAYYTIKSLWTETLELVSLSVDDEDFSFIIKDKNKHKSKKEIIKEYPDLSTMWDYHYMRAIRGKNRHLKLLRLDLGLDNVEEIKKETYVYRDYYHGEIRMSERELTKKGTPKFDGHNIPHVKATTETIKLMIEYNKKREKFLKYKKEISKKLFGENKL